MIVFQTLPQPDSDKRTEIVILFGTGLIGSSVYKHVTRQVEYSSSFLPFNWHDPEQAKQDLVHIYRYLLNLYGLRSERKFAASHIALVWCAGKAGFSALEKDMEGELLNYEIVLSLATKLMDSFSESNILFHHISSAGGLFENQHLIDDHSTPMPLRYYGELKYAQEKSLLSLGACLVKKIYRPTSVYGYIGPGQRMGLIPTLILNGIQNRPSTIFGNSGTLRDYVFNDDIGAYITRNLFNTFTDGKTSVRLLASGKPSSIHEIQHSVEQVIGKKIYLNFHSTPETENTRDITVNSSALPADWSPTDIRRGIRFVKDAIISGKSVKVRTE